jgi:hypothetical protein
MRWDPFLARAVARELHTRLEGGRTRALLLDPERRRVHLFLREALLVVELHPTAGWITLLDPPPELPAEARPLPCRVLAVEALPDESALRLSLPRVRGKEEGVELLLEFSANRGNALVVGHRSRQIRHVLLPRPASRGGRELVPGAPWVPLATGGRMGAPDGPPLEEAAFRERAREGREAMLRGVSLASSLNVHALLGEDGWGWRQAMETPERWGAWRIEGSRGAFLYPLSLPSPSAPQEQEQEQVQEQEHVPSLLQGMARLRSEAGNAPAQALALDPALLARGEARLRRLERKAGALARQLRQAPDPAPLRARGDLLLARFHQVPTGEDRVTLPGFDGEPVEIPLDPALPVHENARRWYDEAARAERARTALPAQVEEARTRAGKLRALLASVSRGEAGPEALLREVGRAPEGGDGKGGAGRGGRGGQGEAATLPYRRFTSSGGLEIRVGRGARRNDDLTFRHAAPDDVWLHVREAPGAHVVLRWSGEGNPPARDLEEAAILAALNSDARHAGTVPVDWTRRKYVRKPRKAPPGAVLPDRVQTLFVAPDPELPGRLSADDGG